MPEQRADTWALVARSVMSELDLDSVFDRVLDAARSLTGARYAALGILDGDRRELDRFVTAGIPDEERRRIGDLPRGRGVLGELIRNPVPLRLADVADHPRSYGFPVGHPPMSTFLGVPVMVRGEPFGNLYLTEKDDGEFTDADEEALLTLAAFAGVAVENAQRYRGAAHRRDELERTVGALEAMTDAAQAVAGHTELAPMLDLLSKRARALVAARSLVIFRERMTEIEIACVAGEIDRGVVGARLPREGTLAGQVLDTRRAERLSDAFNMKRFTETGLGTLGIEAQGGLFVPLIFGGRTHGVIVALDRLVDGPGFTAEDERLLEAFAVSAATAVATAESAATERSDQRLAAAEAERQRWARELHDETLQGLGALKLALQAAQRDGGSDAMADVVARAIDELSTEIGNLRALISELRPPVLDQLGPGAAIETLVARAQRSGLAVDAEVDLAFEQGRAATRHVAELETGVYRIVQEAITNALKHAEPSRIGVLVEEAEDQIRLGVRDDGHGFDPSAATEGFGLLGMRERVELLGGELEVESAPGRGTALRVRLPVKRRAPPDASTRAPHRAGHG